MPYYYKIQCSKKAKRPFKGIEAYPTDFETKSKEQCTKFDFAKYVLIELLDCVTPEEQLWKELGLTDKTSILHKRLMVDAHRVHCRRAIVICINSKEAKNLAQRLSQTKIFKRSVCAVVVQELLFDINLFEKQISHFGDKRSQEQLIYVTDLNPSREPESLVQFLRELFSPFGRILYIFIAKDKKGYAYPEGIVLFSHLSEAFAAELAYDQCIIGMERLSVTVHHNILLSQCDLRTRLKEAQIKNESMSFHDPLECKYVENKSVFPLDTFTDKNNRNPNAVHKTIQHKSNVYSFDYSTDMHENSCQYNMTQYLEQMTISCNNGIKNSLVDTLPLREHSGVDNVIKLTDISNLSSLKGEPIYTLNSSSMDDTISEVPHDTNVTDTSLKNENTATHNDEQSKKMYLHSTVLYDKPLLQKSLLENKPLNLSHLLLPKKFHNRDKLLNAQEQSTEMLSCISRSNDVALFSGNCDSNCLSQTKKDFSLSQKLSLKRQRLHYIHSPSSISDNEPTLTLPTISVSETYNSTMKYTPGKYKSEVSHTDNLQKMKSYHTCQSFDNTTFNKENLKDGKTRNSPNDCINGVVPLSAHRISKTAICQSDSMQRRKKGKLTKECPLQFVSVPRCSIGGNSPLKTWLKDELIYSTNNRVADSTENSRKIVCVTPKRDVLVPVGCSHMTCDFCYPRSTNLLFGFY